MDTRENIHTSVIIPAVRRESTVIKVSCGETDLYVKLGVRVANRWYVCTNGNYVQALESGYDTQEDALNAAEVEVFNRERAKLVHKAVSKALEASK